MVSNVTTTLYWSKLEFSNAPHDAHELHRVLWKAFSGEQRSFLFRADTLKADGSRPRMVVLIQSEKEADWGRLGHALASAEQKRRTFTVRAREQLRFLLRANPTVARKGRAEPKFENVSAEAFRGARGRRVALFGEAERREWLQRKLQTAGWTLHSAVQSNMRSWRWAHSGRAAKHDGLDYEGVIEVVDPEACVRGIVRGFGSGKAFGFGLLSVAPLR